MVRVDLWRRPSVFTLSPDWIRWVEHLLQERIEEARQAPPSRRIAPPSRGTSPVVNLGSGDSFSDLAAAFCVSAAGGMKKQLGRKRSTVVGEYVAFGQLDGCDRRAVDDDDVAAFPRREKEQDASFIV